MGNTGEMLARQQGHLECAGIVHDYILDVGGVMHRVDRVNTHPDRLQQLSYQQLVLALDNLENDEDIFRERTEEKDRFLEDAIHEIEIKLNAAHEEHQRHKIETASDLADIQKKKRDVQAELRQRPETSDTEQIGEASSLPSAPSAEMRQRPGSSDHEQKSEASSLPSAPSAPPPSVIPICPGCRKEMWPPVEIYNCSNGHLICSVCKPKVLMNKCTNDCGALYTGRALAIEKMIRQLLGIV